MSALKHESEKKGRDKDKKRKPTTELRHGNVAGASVVRAVPSDSRMLLAKLLENGWQELPYEDTLTAGKDKHENKKGDEKETETAAKKKKKKN